MLNKLLHGANPLGVGQNIRTTGNAAPWQKCLTSCNGQTTPHFRDLHRFAALIYIRYEPRAGSAQAKNSPSPPQLEVWVTSPLIYHTRRASQGV